MKANTHPDYHEITVVMSDGTEYKTRSTMEKPGYVLRLDYDPLNHPAWTGGTAKVLEKGQIAKFGKRYAGLGIAKHADSKPSESTEAAAAE